MKPLECKGPCSHLSHTPLSLLPLLQQVWALAFSPEGRFLATGDEGRAARLWDVYSGQQVSSLEGHGGAVTSIAWFIPTSLPPLSSLPSSSSDPNLTLRPPSARECAECDHGPAGSLGRDDVHPRGNRQHQRRSVIGCMVTGSDDKSAMVWEILEEEAEEEEDRSAVGDHEYKEVARPGVRRISSRCLAELSGHSGKVTGALLHP